MPLQIVAPLGPNPAALAELVWHLARVEGQTIGAVWAVVESARALRYLRVEILGPGGAWEELRALLGERIPPVERVFVVEASDGEGALPTDEGVREIADALREGLWRAAREAQRAAGEGTVVFALSGGRHRASTALQATVFQLLGRAGDRLVDVRVEPPIAEGGTGFLFPEQRDADLVGVGRRDGEPFSARDITVVVEPITLPRLRPLLDAAHLDRFETALARSEVAIRDATPPEVVVDLLNARVLVDGVVLKLSLDRFVYYAALLDTTSQGRRVKALDFEPLRDLLAMAERAGATWPNRLRSKTLQHLWDVRSAPSDHEDGLVWIRSKMADDVRSWCEAHRPLVGPLLVPVSEKVYEEGGYFNEVYVRLPVGRITFQPTHLRQP